MLYRAHREPGLRVDTDKRIRDNVLMPRVLIVEDDEIMLNMYVKKFTKEGFDISTARDGSIGLVRAVNDVPNVIMLDLMMPESDGFEMLEALHAHPKLKNIPVVVLTNISSDADEQRARLLGATDYLIKAENHPGMVVNRVVELLDKYGNSE